MKISEKLIGMDITQFCNEMADGDVFDFFATDRNTLILGSKKDIAQFAGFIGIFYTSLNVLHLTSYDTKEILTEGLLSKKLNSGALLLIESELVAQNTKGVKNTTSICSMKYERLFAENLNSKYKNTVIHVVNGLITRVDEY